MPVTNPDVLRWDNKLQRFINNRGRVIEPAELRKYIDKLTDLSGQRLNDLGRQLLLGKIRVNRWQTLAAKEIKNVHTAAFTVAVGGKTQLTGEHLVSLSNVVKFQLDHLREFAMLMPAKSQRDGRIPARLESYARAGIGTYENTTLDRNLAYGLSVARRVTAHGSKSCDPCLDEEDLGWQDIREISRIGSTPCGARCNCAIEYEEVS